MVLIPGLTRQYWPFLREDESVAGPATIESERRLLYVAMTRARRQLHLFTGEGDLTHAGKSRDGISPFVAQMNLPHVLALGSVLHDASDQALASAIEKTGLTPVSKRYVCQARPSLAGHLSEVQTSPGGCQSCDDSPWQLGIVIDHSIFGRGRVIEVNDENFSIRFDSQQHGVKRFARKAEIRHLFRTVAD